MVDVAGAHRPRVEVDAAEVHEPQQGHGVVHDHVPARLLVGAPGLVDGVVVDTTAVSKVMPETNSLTYRGYAVQELCEECSFEEVAYLLWHGELPNQAQLAAFNEAEAKERPYDTVHLNVMGTTIALEAAVKNRIERFVYASTMYVYSPFGSFYRASKQAAETIIEAYRDRFSLDYTLLRYGSLYGPRAQDWNGLRRYVAQAVREGKLVYSGTGKERREYIHALDAARLSVDVLDAVHKNQAITVTGQQVLSSQDLIDMIFEIVGKEKKVTFSAENISTDHYALTPYRYTPKPAKKLVPGEFVDIGQGILEMVEEISAQSER